MTEFSVAILCGGRSSRMGQDKAEMKLQAGGPRMVDRLLAAFSDCDEIILSLRDETQLPDLGGIEDESSGNLVQKSGENVTVDQRNLPLHVTRVTDPVSGVGPLAGIVASLRASRHEIMFAAAVDMPYLDKNFAEELLRAVKTETSVGNESSVIPVDDDGDWDILLPADPDGRPHPLCAFYKKSALPVLEECLLNGTYSLWRCFQKLRTIKVQAALLPESDRKLVNLNRPEDVKNH